MMKSDKSQSGQAMAARPARGEPHHRRAIAGIVLAAGQSTRMKSERPKVLHEVCGPPMLAHVLNACREAGIAPVYVVVGFGADLVRQAFAHAPDLRFVEQKERKGTGHAVMMCEEALGDFEGDVVIIAGDMPLIRSETLRALIDDHRDSQSVASIATTVLDDPTGYGRIVRHAGGAFEKIVEHRDCDTEQRKIREVNPSYYCFDWHTLKAALQKVKPDNAKGEYYITDTLGIVQRDGKQVRAATLVPAADATGVNSRVELALVNRLMQQRIAQHWMHQGVTIVSPENTWIDSRAQIGADSVIQPFTMIEGAARIGTGCRVGPYAWVGDGAIVEDGGVIGPGPLSAFDATVRNGGRARPNGPDKASVVRRPPAQTSCG